MKAGAAVPRALRLPATSTNSIAVPLIWAPLSMPLTDLPFRMPLRDAPAWAGAAARTAKGVSNPPWMAQPGGSALWRASHSRYNPGPAPRPGSHLDVPSLAHHLDRQWAAGDGIGHRSAGAVAS